MENEKKKILRRFRGTVVSDKMDKTIVVKVESVRNHPTYGKKYSVSCRYKVHDPKNEYKIDDYVMFEECRPLSKDKRWRVIKKLEKK